MLVPTLIPQPGASSAGNQPQQHVTQTSLHGAISGRSLGKVGSIIGSKLVRTSNFRTP